MDVDARIDDVMVTVGVDTHTDVHVVAVLDQAWPVRICSVGLALEVEGDGEWSATIGPVADF